jgi:hypothetical protein
LSRFTSPILVVLETNSIGHRDTSSRRLGIWKTTGSQGYAEVSEWREFDLREDQRIRPVVKQRCGS